MLPNLTQHGRSDLDPPLIRICKDAGDRRIYPGVTDKVPIIFHPVQPPPAGQMLIRLGRACADGCRLTSGTRYNFVVSAWNSFGESANSAEISARPTSFAPTQPGFTNAGIHLQLNWPTERTGWQLQSQTNRLAASLGTDWVNVAGSDQTNQATVMVSATNGAVFIRLVRP